MFDQISKHLEICQKYSATCCIFNSLLDVWKYGQTLSFVFDILLQKSSLLKTHCFKSAPFLVWVG